MALATQKHLVVYVKTTETCNLNCDHCFTSGTKGRKIYFDPIKTADWCNQLDTGDNRVHFEFHGGEPMLAPLEDLKKFVKIVRSQWDDRLTIGITTNLVYKLKQEYIDFFKDIVKQDFIGTSWDPKIRFTNDKQLKLWEDNVKKLVDEGLAVKCFVSVSTDVVNMEPIKIANYMESLGIEELSYERLTHNGNATINLEIFPHNKQLDNFWMLMHQTTRHHKVKNTFLNTVYDKFDYNETRSGTFCRDCEQKLFTINADGTIAGCPNSAPTDFYGHIDEPAPDVKVCPKRMTAIDNEIHLRNPKCYECPVFNLCHSDCHQLKWMDGVCPAPKSLMVELAKEKEWI